MSSQFPHLVGHYVKRNKENVVISWWLILKCIDIPSLSKCILFTSHYSHDNIPHVNSDIFKVLHH